MFEQGTIRRPFTPWIVKFAWLEKPVAVLGWLLLIVAIAYGYLKWTFLNQQLRERSIEKAALDRSIQDLQREIDRLKNAPVRELVRPRAIATLLPGKQAENGKPVYNMMLWLEVPASRKAEINRVEYWFNHSSYLIRRRIGNEPTNSFQISYEGWGCLSAVNITLIDPQGSRSDPIAFDMCNAIEL